jgi:hypothetical protein
MSIPPLFLPEGHIDKAVTRALLGNRRDLEQLVNRKQGAPGVAKEMELQWKKFGPTRQVVGMVDDDKRFADVAYLAAFSRELYRSDATEAAHSIRQHPTQSSQYLIVLDPACDSWVWQAAVQAGLMLAAYNLPASRRAFVTYSKDGGKGIGQDARMLRLLADIQREKPALFAELANFIKQVMKLA